MKESETRAHSEPLPATGSDACFWTNSLFDEPWWLDAVAPGGWQEAVVRRDGQLVARLPYTVRRRLGMVWLGHPPLSQTLGPWLKPSGEKYSTRLADEHQLLAALIAQLPRFDLFAQTCSPAVANLLPFEWQGFSTSLHYTYRVNELQDKEAIWNGFTKECRNVIRKAQKRVVVHDEEDTDRLYDAVLDMWTRQQTSPPFSRGVLQRLDEACKQRSARRILCAADAEGNVHARLYLAWDKRAAYYLIGTSDPRFRDSGAASLLIWEAVQFAATVSACFDFEGSMNPRIEGFFRSFGAQQTVLPHVRKISRRLSAATAVRDLIQAASGRRIRWFF